MNLTPVKNEWEIKLTIWMSNGVYNNQLLNTSVCKTGLYSPLNDKHSLSLIVQFMFTECFIDTEWLWIVHLFHVP